MANEKTEKISRYKYTVHLNFVQKSEETNIPAECITMILIDYDYKKAMPVIYITLNINSGIYTKISTGTNNGRMSLYIQRYDQDSSISAKKDVVKDLFIYFFPTTNMNYTKELDNATQEGQTDGAYKRVTLGLISSALLDQNKKIFNNLYKNINVATLIQLGISHIPKVIMEPLTYNDNISQIFIPPIDSVSKYIKYLNDCCTFYSGRGYIFFMDFDRTYLLSTNGNIVDPKDGSYNNITIDICSITSDAANSVGFMDDKSKSYIIYADALQHTIDVDRAIDKLVNYLIGVSTNGNIMESSMNTIDEKTSEKKSIIRLPYENMNGFKSIVANMQAKPIIGVSKSEIDSSIFTPNKQYTINNFDGNEKYNNVYSLIYKKDILIQQDGHFMGMIALGLG